MYPAPAAPTAEPPRRRLWVAGCAIAVIGVTFAVARRPVERPAPVPSPAPAPAHVAPSKLGFTVSRQEGDWRIAWDRAAVARLDPLGAMLTIRDGGAGRMQYLSPADLQAGFILYVGRSNDLSFTLKVTSASGDSEERVLVLGPGAATAKTPASKPPVRRVEAPAEPAPVPQPDTPPTAMRMIAALWPEGVPRSGSASVRVRVLVDAEGKAVRAEAVESTSGREAFVQSAVRAVRQWRFAPAMAAGRPVPAETVVTLPFRP